MRVGKRPLVKPVVVPRTYRIGPRTGPPMLVFCIGFLLLGLKAHMERGEYRWLVVAIVVAITTAVVLVRTRMRIDHRGLAVTGVFSATSLRFEDVARARIVMVPGGRARFRVETRHGEREVPLQIFPVAAAAQVFTALEAEGVVIEVADDPRAQRLDAQIRAAQRPRSVA